METVATNELYGHLLLTALFIELTGLTIWAIEEEGETLNF
jgi:hypothetical protein